MRKTSTITAFLSASILATSANAWESECRPEQAAATMFGGHAGSPVDSICVGAEPECEYGLEWTRGALLGEHMWITRRALFQAGLGLFADQPVLAYYTNGSTVTNAEGNEVLSLAPAREGQANAFVERKTTLAEFAQISDGSHSVGDFILGNEHCFVENMPNETPGDLKACHSFNPHMGAVNSTHFLPQARAVYRIYHGLAVSFATKCKEMQDILDAEPDHPLTPYGQEAVEQCERQALMFEAVGSHFLADAWSSGHMWQRWGVPIAAAPPWKRLAQSAVAVISGMIHGWRSVVRSKAELIEAFGIQLQHDQMCMAGPFDPDGPSQESGKMEFVMPEGDIVDGGGDLYLLPCLAYEENRAWSPKASHLLLRRSEC